MVGRQYFPFIQVYWSLLVIFNITWIDGLLWIPLLRWCSSARAWRHCAGRPTTASSCFQARWFNIWGWINTFIIYITYHLSVGGMNIRLRTILVFTRVPTRKPYGFVWKWGAPKSIALSWFIILFPDTGGYTSCHCQTRPYIYTYIHTYMHACMHACMYIHTLHYITLIHTYIHYITYIHTLHTYIHYIYIYSIILYILYYIILYYIIL